MLLNLNQKEDNSYKNSIENSKLNTYRLNRISPTLPLRNRTESSFESN
jgi:hypothetical protein